MLCSSRLLCCYFCISCIYTLYVSKVMVSRYKWRAKVEQKSTYWQQSMKYPIWKCFPSRYCISEICTLLQRDWKFLKKYHNVFQECYGNNQICISLNKVRVFKEGHKNWQNLHRRFDTYIMSNTLNLVL